jgi:hypothetical protein
VIAAARSELPPNAERLLRSFDAYESQRLAFRCAAPLGAVSELEARVKQLRKENDRLAEEKSEQEAPAAASKCAEPAEAPAAALEGETPTSPGLASADSDGVSRVGALPDDFPSVLGDRLAIAATQLAEAIDDEDE